MADTEVQIGNKVIGENTKVTVTIKVLAWVLGGLVMLISALFSMAYFDLKSELEATRESFESERAEYTETVTSELNKVVEKLREKDDDFLRELGDIKGNVKVILDRTSTYRQGQNGGGFNNNTPVDEPFVNNHPN